MPLTITAEIAERIGLHGESGYPHEVCGALLGRDDGGDRKIIHTLPLVNQREDSPRSRFAITSDDVRRAEAAARGQQLDLVGWYHSHPDHPARPSEFDREHAWPWYSYVIVSVVNGKKAEMTSWRLSDDRSGYQPELIEIAAREESQCKQERAGG